MKLKKLFKDIPLSLVKGSKEIEITGVCANSKLVSPGNLFIARKGFSVDGSLYIPEAVSAGAAAVLTDIYDPLLNKSITQLIHSDVSTIEGAVAASYYQHASQSLFVVGITGTNGKTTTSFLIKHLLDCLHSPCGLIGTIEYIIGPHRYQAIRTTPDVCTMHKMLREMVLQGCQSAVMEVTSHALDQGRVDGIDFDIAIFTNFSSEHLDYHKTMDAYAAAKNKLFRRLNLKKQKKVHSFPKTAVINIDDPAYSQITQGCATAVLTYGIVGDADLKAEEVAFSASGTTLTMRYQEQKVSFKWPFVGMFNVYNCLAATAVGLIRGVRLETMAEIWSRAPAVPGRLESVSNPLGLNIYVDFAHTDDALRNVLGCLRSCCKKGRLITVFGCGGNRDTTKRPKMARVAEELSDVVIVTSDNPRNEDPQEIISQVVTGFSDGYSYDVDEDRTQAIARAIALATPDDIILIAGKGHEPYQVFAHKTVEFDDRKVAYRLCCQ